MSDRLRPLDGVRGIAALIIACFLHWHDNINPNFVLLRFWNGYLDGRILVEFFFLISGLTFTAFYMKRIANSEVSFSDFIYSRFVRLAPLYYGTLFYVTFMLILRKIFSVGTFTYQYNDVHHFVLNLLMIQNYGLQTDANFNAISWTVCIEVLMCIVFFVVCKMTKTKHTYFAICWGLIIVGYTLEKSDWKGSTFTLVNASIGRGMIAFFFGSLLYFLLLKAYQGGIRLKLIMFSILLIVVSIYYFGGVDVWSHGDWWYMLSGFVFIIYPIMIYLITTVKLIRCFLLLKPLQYLGKISFTIYMCHYPVQLTMDFINKVSKINGSYDNYFIWGLYCVCVVTISSIINAFYEKPLINWLRKYKDKIWKDEKLSKLEQF